MPLFLWDDGKLFLSEQQNDGKVADFSSEAIKTMEKNRWTPSESIYTFFQEIEKCQIATSSDTASSIRWKVAAAPRSVTPRSRCSLRSFDTDDHTRG